MEEHPREVSVGSQELQGKLRMVTLQYKLNQHIFSPTFLLSTEMVPTAEASVRKNTTLIALCEVGTLVVKEN